MKNNIRKLAAAAVAAAAYAVLTLVLAPISFGPLQFRVSEALCALAIFDPLYAVGLFIGCLIANIIGSGSLLDVVFGSLATLGAGLAMVRVGRGGKTTARCALACLMPVLFNGVVVGAVLAASYASREAFWLYFLLYGLQVAGGEAAVMLLLGLPLARLLPKQAFFSRFFS